MSKRFTRIKWAILSGSLLFLSNANAQTDADGIMMYKNQFCVGPMYEYSSWNHYWEGSFKRNNANLGTVSTQMVSVMGTYGINNHLNVLFNLPYVSTKASAGQMHPMKGLQDLSLWVKWQPLQQAIGKSTLSLFALAGYAVPTTNYEADYLPLAIGLHSKTASVRAIVDYQIGTWFATGSATYNRRSNITIDRKAYYTTEMHYSDEVKMPDATQYQLRAGYRSHRLMAEALLTRMETLGGFDITKNNMPFPSNNMDATMAGVSVKYEFGKYLKGFSLMGGSNYTVAGRNVGQSTAYYGTVLYVINFNKD